ncbi:MAG: hypothetical protein U5R31_02805 [Acidimicrobiia bacterium]|nr:hypothetical protein [Acidimicrobiia bacterium]
MRGHHLDRQSQQRLLSGSVDPEDAPPGYQPVAGLLATLREPAAPGGSTVSARPASSALQTWCAATPPPPPPPRPLRAAGSRGPRRRGWA